MGKGKKAGQAWASMGKGEKAWQAWARGRRHGMYSLGYEKQIDASAYSWDGQTRGEKDIIIFQYTVKGHGAIRIEDYVYQLKKGDAFFVRVPSKHTIICHPIVENGNSSI